MKRFLALSLRVSLSLLKAFLKQLENPQSKPAIAQAATPTPPTIDLAPEQVEQITVAETASIAMLPEPAPKLAVAETASLAILPTHLPQSSPNVPSDEQKPFLDRASLVHGLLDEAWSVGRRTYPQLIEYVKTHSGEGCSKRMISQWKKARGLVQEQAQEQVAA